MKLIKVFLLCLILSSCSNEKKQSKIYKSIDYKDLNIFISDSIPPLLEFDKNHLDIFSLWKDIFLIKSVRSIVISDPRQLSFTLSALQKDILKINDVSVPSVLSRPRVIGRFRVLKTDILKIDIDNLSIENFKTFQNHLRDIVVSYNAFVNIMNLEVTKDNNEDFMKD